MIEITRQDGVYIYRQNEDDPCLIERKLNKAGSRWTFWLRRDTAAEARAALLAIGKGTNDDVPTSN